MTDAYYSDRVSGSKPRTVDQVDETLWMAVQALLQRGIDGAWFAQDFPRRCEDGNGIYACDDVGLIATLRAEIPDLDPYGREVPPTLAVLDLIEFMHRHACEASEGKYHSFFDHHHLRFDRIAGQKRLRDAANRLLGRSGSSYELTDDGHIERLVPEAISHMLRRDLPATRDGDFDQLLEAAVKKYLDPDPDVRADALEKLWDAFERVKTILDPEKKKGAEQLVAAATADVAQQEAQLLVNEMRTLTSIGNEFRIRHHETRAAGVSSALVDQLFPRMYALLVRVHSAVR